MMSRWQSTIVDAKGNIQPSAVLRILNEADQSLALVYQTNNDLQPYPLGYVTANANGFAYFYAAPGRYRIQSIDLDIDWRDVEIGGLSVARAALENSGMSIYNTQADMQADTPTESPVYARVVNDANSDLNGFYIWDGSTWARTTEQPADGDKVLRNDIPQYAPLLHSIPQSGVVELQFALDALRAATRNVLYGDGPYPTLDLRFAGATMLDPSVDFARASTATYFDAQGVLRTAGVDEPRFDHDPATGEPLGLLVEGSATNLVADSIDGVGGWHTSGLDVEEVFDIDPPIAGARVYKVARTSPGGRMWGVYSPGNTSRTFSAYYMATSPETEGAVAMKLRSDGGSGGSGPADIIYGRWKRSSIHNANIGTGTDRDVYPIDYRASRSYENEVDEFYICCPQVETTESPVPSSYIPTYGAPATRAETFVTRQMGAEFDPERFTIAGEIRNADWDTAYIASGKGLTGFYAPPTERLALELSTAGSRRGTPRVAARRSASYPARLNEFGTDLTPPQSVIRYALAYDAAAGTISGAVNGESTTLEYDQGAPNIVEQALLDLGLNRMIKMHRANVRVYPVALDEATLAAMTALPEEEEDEQ